MKHEIKHASAARQRTGCAVVGAFEGKKLAPAARLIDAASGGALTKLVRRGDIQGKVGSGLILHRLPGIAAERVLVAGCGPERELDARRYRDVTARSARQVQDSGAGDAVSYLPELQVRDCDSYGKVLHGIEATEDALYEFDEWKTKRKSPKRPLARMGWALERTEREAGRRAVRDGEAIAAGVRLAKDLANRPPNVCTPTHLAEQAVELARRYSDIKATVIDDAQMRKLGMGSLLSVARGSREPPKLIILEYRGRRDRARPVALVGKGVTFDSGGISIKPAAAMDEMKFDMSGAAAVLGTVAAVAQMKLETNLVAAIPATENLPGGNASRPGDIVTSLSGQTIEILNTDAEGRLILCDALTYIGRYEPVAVIDVATLTGACVVALGKIAAGLFSNHPQLAERLLDAGQVSCDRAWQLPLWDDYQRQLDSNFADMANVGGREGGSITAACFLSRFTEKYHWAHLDIAGIAYKTGKEKGATGRPVPLLVRYLIDQAK
jgi:leucyl aminopeptidase